METYENENSAGQNDDKLYQAINQIANSQKDEHRLVDRAKIIQGIAAGKSKSEVARELNCDYKTVDKWQKRFDKAVETAGKAIVERAEKNPKIAKQFVRLVLQDELRSGRPPIITLEQKANVLNIWCKKPSDYGLPDSEWTCGAVRDIAAQEGYISEKTAISTVWKIAESYSIHPHKCQMWLHSAEKETDPKS